MDKEKSLTPMLKQYLQIKEKHKDKILFFRMGDFYEMFFEDAKIASKILNIALTSRHKESNIPMCGIPYHALSNYTQKLLDSGYKIAICEQIENPKDVKTIVKRDVVKVLTPAINSEIDNLFIEDNYFLFAYYNKTLAIVDFSSGEFFFEKNITYQLLINEIEKHLPKELLVTKQDFEKLKKETSFELYNITVNYIKPEYLSNENNEINDWLKNLEKDVPYEAVTVVLHYIIENNRFIPEHLQRPTEINIKKYLELDENVLTHLEILKNSTGKTENSLFRVLNSSKTPMGGRLLKKWLSYPLTDPVLLNKRYDFVEELTETYQVKKKISETIAELGDIERLNGKIALKNILPQNLISLKNYINLIPIVKSQLLELKSKLAKELYENLPELREVVFLISNFILGEPSNNLSDGDYINNGVSEELDEYRDLRLNARKWLLEYEKEIKDKYGISNLKVKFNKVFGYFIEVSKKNSVRIPENFLRKQTLVNAERYITEELKIFEEKILSADEKIDKIQKSLYKELLDKLLSYCFEIKKASEILATIDILNGFASKALKRDYVKPVINKEHILKVVEGRHPVLEEIMDEEFIPNDLIMDANKNIFIITGPNMAGKSTYMRQNALLIIMAQIGSFVPAKKFNYKIFDKIFTRIGAKDRLLEGESTFMVEMTETSKILNNLTENSFIILDEIGRGTSTFDGMSIAWAVLEFLATHKNKFFVLFATHYHELTELEDEFENIFNYSVNVKEIDNKLLFLRRIKKGAADRSYGIEVAHLAKIPKGIIDRAKEILHKLEDRNPPEINIGTREKSIFEIVKENQTEEILNKIKSIDLNNTTPIESLNLLFEIQDSIKKLP